MAFLSCIPSSSSSSSSTPQWEVFLSFIGEDTREKFVDHLYAALRRKGIPTFKDDEKLETGSPIGPELLKAIEESRYSIVVLSENYASSRWCLDELVHILGSCSRKNNAIGRRHSTIYPVFYHVDPSNVRRQDGSFGKGFAEAASKHGEEKAEKWRTALKEVGNLKGWKYPSNEYRFEAKFIEALVGKICSEGDGIYASVGEDLVGIHSRVEKVIQLLGLGLNDHACAVGIWGMGGTGKTTIAREVFDRICHQFEAFSYLEHVREVSTTRSGLLALQQQLLYDILRLKDSDISNTFIGESMIRNRMCNKRVLIVLDDVDKFEQLDKLVVKLDRLKVGSRIIITTRDKQVLIAYDVGDIYEVEMLNRVESIKLFISKAFGNKQQQTSAFKDLVERAAEYARGVPLALKLLGSSLKGKNGSEWESALNRLKEEPDQNVFQVLKISYEALQRTQQQIFLDIACFLKGENITRATQILDSCGYHAKIGISNLVDKSLISFKNDEVWMHDLIQELGWDIVRQESRDPGKRSRLWLYDDVYRVLKNNTGTEAVESIVLQFSEKKELLSLEAEAFAKMTKLRFLKICNAVQLPNGLKCLSNELRYLNWDAYPLKCIPQTFRPKDLVELRFTNSCLEQFLDGELHLPNLRKVDFRHSRNLTKCPDFTKAPKLESVFFDFCGSLVDAHQLVGVSARLKELHLRSCMNLRSLPTNMDFESLVTLDLSDCSKLMNIPEISGNMKHLRKLLLKGTGIIELPLSVGHLDNLSILDLSDCQNLRSLPDSICQLKALIDLDLTRCSKLEKLPSSSGVHRLNLSRLRIGGCKKVTSDSLDSFVSLSLSEESLTELEMGECNLKSVPAAICRFSGLEELKLNGNDFEILPDGMNRLSQLRTLNLEGCKRLEVLPELTPQLLEIHASDCQSLRTILSPSTYKYLHCFDFVNCISLLGNEQILDVLIKVAIQEWPNSDVLLHLQSANCIGGFLFDREIRFPGCEIPKWFSRDKVELYLTNRQTLRRSTWARKVGKIPLVFAACAVVEIEEIYDEYSWTGSVAHIDIEGRPIRYLDAYLPWSPTDTENLWITFGHFLLPIDEVDRLDKLGGSELVTLTLTSERPGFKIKRCGLRVWLEEYDFRDESIHGNQPVEEEEEDNDVDAASMPKRRRLGCSETGNLNDNVDDDDDKEEEEDKHPIKKKLRQFFEPTAMDLDLNEEAAVGPSGSRSLDEEEEGPSMDLQLRI